MRTLKVSPINACAVALLAPLIFLAAPRLRAADEAPAEARPQKSWQQLRPERVVSENTFIYIATPDIKKARAAFDRTAFSGLLDEEDIAAPVAAAFGKLRETYVKGDGTRSEAELRRRNEEVNLLVKLAPMLDGPVALAVEGDLQGLGALINGKLPRFLLVTALPPGEAGAERLAQFDQAFERYRAVQAADVHFTDFDLLNGAYAIHGLENRDQNTYEAWALVENLFLYGQGKGMVEEAVARFSQRNGAGTLALNAGYQSVYSKVGRDEHGEALLYIQVDALPLLSAVKPDNLLLKRLLPGAAAMQANRPQLALGVQVGPGEDAPILEKLLVRGSKELLPKGNDYCKGECARFAAGDTLFFTAAQGNLAELLASWQDVLLAAGGQDAAAAQSRINSLLDVKSADEIPGKLAIFKGEVAVIADYVPKMNSLENWTDCLLGFRLVVALELDRENAAVTQALGGLMARVETATGQQYVKTSYAGTTIHYQRGAAPGEDRGGAGPLGLFANLGSPDLKTTPFFTAYTTVDLATDSGAQARKFLLLSDDLNALKKAVAQKNTPHTALGEEPRFKNLMKSFKESRYEMSYLDLNKLISVYKTVLPLLGRSGLVSRDFIAQMPNASTLQAHFFPMAWAKSVLADPDGTLLECSSPTGNLPLVGLIASLAWPAYNAAQQRAISAEVDNHFKQILLGLYLYAADFDRFPSQLSDLIPTYISEQDWKAVFESPFNRGALNVPTDVDNPGLTNLVYLPNKSLYDLGREVVLYEKECTRVAGADNRRLLYHVLTVDGKIKGLPYAALERALAGKAELVNTDTSAAAAPTPR